MAARRLYRYDIVSRAAAPRGNAAHDDFILSLAVSGATMPSVGVGRSFVPLAYSIDFMAERVVFTLHRRESLSSLFGAAFLFPEQLRCAEGVLSIPLERLGDLGPPGPAMRPVFVFSPGRTGSTLLMRLLSASGIACASEPDMLTQIARMGQDNRTRFGPAMETILAGACVASLGRALGPGAFMKLRSQCNERPLAPIEASPGCRAVFMLRGLAPWALSRHRVFDEPPIAVAAVLRQALDALDKLAGTGIALDVVWYERLVADPHAALRICAPGAMLTEAALACVMQADSQAGTDLARDKVACRRAEPGFMAAFEAAWAEARAGAEWSAQTEACLVGMRAGCDGRSDASRS